MTTVLAVAAFILAVLNAWNLEKLRKALQSTRVEVHQLGIRLQILHPESVTPEAIPGRDYHPPYPGRDKA